MKRGRQILLVIVVLALLFPICARAEDPEGELAEVQKDTREKVLEEIDLRKSTKYYVIFSRRKG